MDRKSLYHIRFPVICFTLHVIMICSFGNHSRENWRQDRLKKLTFILHLAILAQEGLPLIFLLRITKILYCVIATSVKWYMWGVRPLWTEGQIERDLRSSNCECLIFLGSSQWVHILNAARYTMERVSRTLC